MSDEWIVEVLSDLRAFAEVNQLPALTVQLERTLAVADRELRHSRRAASGASGAEAERG